jgi:SM-20-related protein
MRDANLILHGGHVVKLGDAVDLMALVRCLKEGNRGEETIEIHLGKKGRLIVRRDALIGVMDGHSEDPNTEPVFDGRVGIKPFLQVHEFLSSEEHKILEQRVIEREADFESSKVSTGREDYRKSKILKIDDIIGPMFRSKIQSLSVDLSAVIGVVLDRCPDFSQIECQITAHGDGGFYHAHSDNGSDDTASRVFSYAYYFQTCADAFFGGELRLYGVLNVDEIHNTTSYESFMIRPQDNSIVFFPSHVMHEILPTYVPSRLFKDSRFTVNGWVRRA